MAKAGPIICTSAPTSRCMRRKGGSGHVQIFRPGMLQRLQENKSFEDDLLQALSHDEFKVYYQPIADTVTREIYGYEALVRWFHRCAARR